MSDREPLSPVATESGQRADLDSALRQVRSELEQARLLLGFQERRADALLRLPELAEDEDEATFLRLGMEFAEDLTGSEISFIHFVGTDQETIELVTWSKRTLGHFCGTVSERHYPIKEAGIWANAVHEKRAVVYNDYAAYPHKRGLPEGHAVLHRVISVPVMEDGRVVMLTGVGNKASDYTETDVQTVQLLSDKIWHIARRRRSAYELEVRARALEHSGDMIALLRSDCTYQVTNPEYAHRFGLRTEDFEGRTVTEVFGDEFFRSVIQPHADRCLSGEEVSYDAWFDFPSGDPAYLRVRYSPYRNTAGEVVGFVLSQHDVTALKKAEKEADRLAQIVANSSDMMALVDRGFRYLAANPAFADAFGLGPEDMIARHLAEFGDREGYFEEHVRPLAERCMSTGKAVGKETWFDFGSGDQRYFTVDYYPYREAGEDVIGFAIHARDITARKQGEEALVASEARFRGLMEQAPFGIGIFDTEGSLKAVNQGVMETFGLPAEIALEINSGRRLLDLEAGDQYREHFLEALGGETSHLLARVDPSTLLRELGLPQDGVKQPWVSLTLFPLRNDSGEVSEVVGTVEDITERVLTVENLSESEASLRHALEAADAGAFSWNLDTLDVRWSESSYRLFGVDPAVTRASHDVWRACVHTDDRCEAEGYVETRLANGRDLSFEYRIVLPDGAMRWIHTVGEHRPDASGPGRRVFGINIDVTDRKGAEAALKHAAREQQALTHRLQEVREDERTLLARELHDEVGQNLTVARMDLSVLESIPPEDRPAAKWQFERLQATMDHSLDLIRDMAVRMRPPVLDVLGLSAAVEAYIGDFTDRFGSLACQLDLANAPEDVAGDVAIAAYRIVQEALTNVASHSEATEVAVSLREENGWLTVRVDDNGIGIAPDAPHALKALGLLGMRERAEALSGQLVITPGAHGGTRVQADLPLGPVGSPPTDPSS